MTETHQYEVEFTTEARWFAIVPATSPEEAEEKVASQHLDVNWDRIHLTDFGYDEIVVVEGTVTRH
mgnify:FL=1